MNLTVEMPLPPGYELAPALVVSAGQEVALSTGGRCLVTKLSSRKRTDGKGRVVTAELEVDEASAGPLRALLEPAGWSLVPATS